jgi:hypothetical protein
VVFFGCPGPRPWRESPSVRWGAAGELRELGMNHVIRVNAKVRFASGRFDGLLSQHGVREGGHRDPGIGRYAARRPVERRVILGWERGYETPLLLGTDLSWNWRKVVEVFRRRMSIEELFRDEKNTRYGWGLRQTKVGTAGRLERLFLVLAYAYLLLLLIGPAFADAPGAGRTARVASPVGRLSPVARRRKGSRRPTGCALQLLSCTRDSII